MKKRLTAAIMALVMLLSFTGCSGSKQDKPVPENYEEFAEACRRFEEKGITPFLTDYNADYSCPEVMQGSAIPELMSLEGTIWRKSYESETQDGSNPIRQMMPYTKFCC